MKDRLLSGSILILIFFLGLALLLPDRSISGFMQTCGEFISDVLGN